MQRIHFEVLLQKLHCAVQVTLTRTLFPLYGYQYADVVQAQSASRAMAF